MLTKTSNKIQYLFLVKILDKLCRDSYIFNFKKDINKNPRTDIILKSGILETFKNMRSKARMLQFDRIQKEISMYFELALQVNGKRQGCFISGAGTTGDPF